MEKSGKGGDDLSRGIRKLAVSNVYHIIMRGIDKQDVFYDDKDKVFFLYQLFEVKKKFNLQIYAYCLMYNHIHLVIRVKKDLLSKSIQSLGIRYSQYFNKKYNRSGSFFEERFNSKCIENKKYLMDVCRYVHRNPENAGFATVEDYKWSSYNEYIKKEKIIEKKVLLYYFDNDINKFKEFTINYKRDLFQQTRESLEYEFIKRLTDEDLGKIIVKRFKLKSISDISKFDQIEKINFIKELSEFPGTNVTQLSRVTRINRKLIQKYIDNKNG